MIDPTEDQKRDALAQHICNLPSLDARREFIARLALNKGAAFADDIRRRIADEWARRKRGMTQEEPPHANP